MKGNFMPKLNNKGFGLIPILVISLLIGVFGIFTFNYLSSNGVLSKSENRDLAQVNIPDYTSPNKTVPSKAVIEVTLSFNETSGYQTGYIRLNFKGSSNNINALRYDLNKFGLEVQDYCMTQVCPKPRIVKPRVNLVSLNPVEAEIEVPVTPMVKSIAYKSYPQRNRYDMPDFVFKNRLENWIISLNDESRTFSLVRYNESTNIGVYIKSANLTTGQTNLEFLINGIGDGTADFIRSVRVNGIKRIDRIGETYKTSTVRPNVVYRSGQGVMNIAALSNTSTIYFLLGDNKVEFLPVPSSWNINQKGDGLDKISTGTPPIISITEMKLVGSNSSNFNFVVKSSDLKQMEKVIQTIKNEGITVAKCNNYASCYYPVQKPNIVCGNYSTVGCRFTVNVPSDTQLIYINYQPGNLVNSVIQLIPRGWVSDYIGTGINKLPLN